MRKTTTEDPADTLHLQAIRALAGLFELQGLNPDMARTHASRQIGAARDHVATTLAGLPPCRPGDLVPPSH